MVSETHKTSRYVTHLHVDIPNNCKDIVQGRVHPTDGEPDQPFFSGGARLPSEYALASSS
jgi:hypothetical protein